MEELNPYAAPKASILPEIADASSIRMPCLRAEANLKACGVFSITIGVFVLLATINLVKNRLEETGNVYTGWAWVTTLLPFLPLSSGIGLCLLRRWGWVLAFVFYGFCAVNDLFRLPRSIFTLLTEIIFLVCLLASTTQKVMSKDYLAVRAATPELTSHVASWGWWAMVLYILTVGILRS
ncbi:hypothetical protein [Prosthecobacter sp.]|jgi:hypothetical protein|uniref:hypothetical protein n=1 Tax=Prosthecobacter sp. TaxID=1965333 RepID=UPI0037C9DAB2